MALWGRVMVNAVMVAEWSAQRLDELVDDDQVSLYLAEYTEWSQLRETYGTLVRAVIEHRYSDGAAVLAQKVLQLAEGGWTS